MIEAIDTAVGTLVKGLEARGFLDNTLIFFMSDNGANAESRRPLQRRSSRWSQL